MQNTDVMGITWPGRVIIEKGQIVVEGFAANNASCRDLATMAAAWAIGELQREMLKNIERPGGGNIGIGAACDYGLSEAAAKQQHFELEITEDGMPLLMHEGKLKDLLLYAAGHLAPADRLVLIEQLQASHQEVESRFR